MSAHPPKQTSKPLKPRLRVLQYNVGKSIEVMIPMFQEPSTFGYDILAVQEPWKNSKKNQTYHPAPADFHICHPNRDGVTTRVCTYVSKKIPMNKWYSRVHSGDLVTVTLKPQEPGQKTLHIHNIYNASPSQRWESQSRRIRNRAGDRTATRPAKEYSEISSLDTLRTAIARNPADEHLIVGDFNLHHPLWTGPGRHQHPEASQLIDIINEANLEMLTPEGMTTFKTRKHSEATTIDLSLATTNTADTMVKCGITKKLDLDSDHEAILTELDRNLYTMPPREVRNWKKMDVTEFQGRLRAKIPIIHQPIDTVEKLDEQVQELVNILTEAAVATTPLSKITAKSKTFMDGETKKAMSEVRKRFQKWQFTRFRSHRSALNAARNFKKRLIKGKRTESWRQHVEECDSDEKLWRLGKQIKNGWARTASFTPELAGPNSTIATEAEEKMTLLRDTFFPKARQARLDDLEGYEYPAPKDFPEITNREIEQAILTSHPNKAAGEDGLTFRILQHALKPMETWLGRIYNACLDLGYCPKHFRHSKTVVLRKPGKADYTQPKSYRPIALLSTLGKGLEKIIATRISYLVETHQLLPKEHTGGRKLSSIENAIHMVLEGVHKAWKSKDNQVASLLMLDVKGAFDNVSHPRLLHNLRKRGISEKATNWIKSFLGNRSTVIAMPEGESPRYEVETGIPQGSPISPILYLFYNADIADTCRASGHLAPTYIDDVSVLVRGPTAQANCETLKEVYADIQQWAETHASEFGLDKYKLIHFWPSATRTMKKQAGNDQDAPLNLGNFTIKPSKHARLLGLELDSGLEWTEHIKSLEAKAVTKLNGLASCAGSAWGVPYEGLRKLYQGMILPTLMFGCTAWFTPLGTEYKVRQKRIYKTFRAIQKRAACIISGGFKNVAGAALDIECHQLPVQLALEKAIAEAVLRVQTCPNYETIKAIRVVDEPQKPTSKIEKLRSPLEQLEGIAEEQWAQGQMEKRIPYVTPPWWEPPVTKICRDRERSIAEHNKIIDTDLTSLHVYTDGSGIDDKIGASAWAPQIEAARTRYLGDSEHYTVYSGELEGIDMACDIAIDTKPPALVIWTDNQAAIQSTADPGGQSGQYILRRIVGKLNKLKEMDIPVTLRWIAAHEDVPGNEAADALAKEASQQGTEGNQYCLLSAAKQRIRKLTQANWGALWEACTRGLELKRYVPAPHRSTMAFHTGVKKAVSSVVTQLRTKIALKSLLYIYRAVDTPECPCKRGDQTRDHILRTCPLFAEDRMATWGGQPIDIKEILSKPDMATKAAKFMIRTQTLKVVSKVKA